MEETRRTPALWRKLPLALALAALLAVWCLWYARPVGVDTLYPDLEPDEISVFMTDYIEKSMTLRSVS